MRKIVTFLTVILLSGTGMAQNKSVSGQVLDKTSQKPLQGVMVYIPLQDTTFSDINGHYELTVPKGSYQIICVHFGYSRLEENVDLSTENSTLNLNLSEITHELNEIVVSAGRFEQNIGEVPVSIIVIKPNLIENKAITAPEALVDQIPGVQVLENQISIRGGSGFSYGSGSRVLVMIDDMPILSGDAGDVKWNALPIENLSQMEVLKGASSVLYGSSALNGVINIRTAYPKSKPETKINLSSGVYMPGYGFQKGRKSDGSDTTFNRSNQQWWDGTQYYTSANFLHSQIIKKNLDLVIGGNVFSDQGYKQGADEYRYRVNVNTRWRSKKIDGLSYGLNGNYNRAKGHLFFLWENADSVLIPQGGIDTATTSLSQFLTQRLNLDPFVTYHGSKNRKHQYKGRLYQTINTNNTNQSSTAVVYYNEYQFQQRFKNDLRLTSGLVNMLTNVSSQLYGDHQSNNLALFGQIDKKWKQFNFTGGLRIEHYRIDTIRTEGIIPLTNLSLPFQPVLRLGTTYKAAKATHLRLSFGQGYRFPTIAEKFISTTVGILKLFPNPNIKAEHGWNSELGIKQGFKIGQFKGYVDLAGFVTEYDNMMEFTFGLYDSLGKPWDIETMGFPSFNDFGAQSKNVEKARISGGELTITGTGEIGKFNINVLGGYTYLNPVSLNTDSTYLTTFSDTITDILKYRAKHMAKFDIELSYWKVALGCSGRYNSFIENIDQTFVDPFLGNLILPGYADYRDVRRVGDFVIDARLSVQVNDHHKVALLMNNVLNREYSNRPGNVLPPRTVIAQYSLKF